MKTASTHLNYRLPSIENNHENAHKMQVIVSGEIFYELVMESACFEIMNLRGTCFGCHLLAVIWTTSICIDWVHFKQAYSKLNH